jgi:hypothetical protein
MFMFYTDDRFQLNEQDREFLRKGVMQETIRSYKGVEKYWAAYLRYQKLPASFKFIELTEHEQRSTLVKYMRYLKEIGYSSGAVRKAVAQLRFDTVSCGQSVKIFDEDETVKLARRAIRESKRETSIRKDDHKRFPVTIDMISWMRGHYYVKGNIDQQMTYIGCVLAFAYMWRSSQYIMSNGGEDHHIHAEDVQLYVSKTQYYYPWEMRDKKVNTKAVDQILFIVRSGKMGNETNYLNLGRKSPLESQLVNDIVEWCKSSGVRKGDPLLSRYQADANCRNRHKKLTRRMVSQALKITAQAHGLNALAFASHSLRIGGSTSLKAKGASRKVIKRIAGATAGWSEESAADEIYQLGTELDDNALSISRTCFRVLTSEEVKRMETAVQRQPAKRARGTMGN